MKNLKRKKKFQETIGTDFKKDTQNSSENSNNL